MTSERARRRRGAMPAVACFGEVLWDCLPRGLFLGGAPMNVAYHLARQGLRAWPVTAVGRDFLGDEARRRIAGWGIETRFIARHRNRPTGTVRATLDAAGVARYRIERNVAWDRIEAPAALRRLAPPPDAIVFGTLALREPANRRALDTLLEAWPETLRVTDLNFRAPFDGRKVIEFALARAQVVKLNEDELGRWMGRRIRGQRTIERGARELAARHRVARVCVTAGARGAGLLWDDAWHWEHARPVDVRDTVGAGDAFLAGLLGATLNGAPPQRALARACRLGGLVASCDGATPDYALDDWRG